MKAEDGLISHDQILSLVTSSVRALSLLPLSLMIEQVTSPFVNLLGSMPDSVRRMSWDTTGERMLVHGARVAIVQCRASDRLPTTFVAASKPLAPQLPSNSVLAVEWHALSVGHIVLLTSDAVRIYCLDRYASVSASFFFSFLLFFSAN